MIGIDKPLKTFLSLICLFLLNTINSQKYGSHQQDVIYGYRDGMALVMDIYYPGDNTSKSGIIVLMCGGMNSSPLWSHQAGERPDIQHLLEEGFVVFATALSSQPKYTTDESSSDIPRAVRFIRYNAVRLGVHPDRIGVMGYSSGAHVALMAGLASPPPNPEAKDPVDRISSKVQAVVAYSPSTDLLNFGKTNTSIIDHFSSFGYYLVAPFDYHEWNPESYRFERVEEPQKLREYFEKNSPVSFVSADDPPVLLIHGEQDKLVPIQQSEILVKLLKEAEVTHELHEIKGRGHGLAPQSKEESLKALEWFKKYLNQD
ncbi:alpha/beta hydrolase family protein [Lentiprolixibacter aurantiacus]|uniref:Prolyl oligopeptidase family serine peptidase n=1 Tax=Lentiprolixibacter aurantiacus TaxID=2993939 RepID=A0AAE3MIM7_9FLAO|nr:alpha/beta fold hydrolase [Lentiprolixibacter aurantiacus]MCX2718123.1 prolyl oligopeptidase family serine peptidase [Lentiprolixibacter aurantiacus]